MEPSFWRARWAEHRIAFHEGRPNELLQTHHAWLGAHRRVLVPLCGKADDLAYLASLGHEVVGVELVEDAARAFFSEHGLEPTVRTHGPFTVLNVERLTLVVGDFFQTTRALLGPVDAFYDRAALVALPETMRPDYVEQLRALLTDDAPGLLITVEYDPPAGPPFPVHQDEVRRLFAGAQLEPVESKPSAGRLAELGAVDRLWQVRLVTV